MKVLHLGIVSIFAILLVNDTAYGLRSTGKKGGGQTKVAAKRGLPAAKSTAAKKPGAKIVAATSCQPMIDTTQKEVARLTQTILTTVNTALSDVSLLSIAQLHATLSKCESLRLKIGVLYKTLFATLINAGCLDELNDSQLSAQQNFNKIDTQLQRIEQHLHRMMPAAPVATQSFDIQSHEDDAGLSASTDSGTAAKKGMNPRNVNEWLSQTVSPVTPAPASSKNFDMDNLFSFDSFTPTQQAAKISVPHNSTQLADEKVVPPLTPGQEYMAKAKKAILADGSRSRLLNEALHEVTVPNFADLKNLTVLADYSEQLSAVNTRDASLDLLLEYCLFINRIAQKFVLRGIDFGLDRAQFTEHCKQMDKDLIPVYADQIIFENSTIKKMLDFAQTTRTYLQQNLPSAEQAKEPVKSDSGLPGTETAAMPPSNFAQQVAAEGPFSHQGFGNPSVEKSSDSSHEAVNFFVDSQVPDLHGSPVSEPQQNIPLVGGRAAMPSPQPAPALEAGVSSSSALFVADVSDNASACAKVLSGAVLNGTMDQYIQSLGQVLVNIKVLGRSFVLGKQLYDFIQACKCLDAIRTDLYKEVSGSLAKDQDKQALYKTRALGAQKWACSELKQIVDAHGLCAEIISMINIFNKVWQGAQFIVIFGDQMAFAITPQILKSLVADMPAKEDIEQLIFANLNVPAQIVQTRNVKLYLADLQTELSEMVNLMARYPKYIKICDAGTSIFKASLDLCEKYLRIISLSGPQLQGYGAIVIKMRNGAVEAFNKWNAATSGVNAQVNKMLAAYNNILQLIIRKGLPLSDNSIVTSMPIVVAGPLYNSDTGVVMTPAAEIE